MAINQFLTFGIGSSANVMSYEEYKNLPERDKGFQSGIAKSLYVNTPIRQASFVAAAVSQFIVEKSGKDVKDDGNITDYTLKLIDAIEKIVTEKQVTSGNYVGKFDLSPYRAGELSSGWYFANGDTFLIDSIQGEVLNGLPSNFKSDWGIKVSSGRINLPNLFNNDGNGYFFRPANGGSRQVGSQQTDAIRNITGTFPVRTNRGTVHNFSGAFYSPGDSWTDDGWSSNANLMRLAVFDASLVVPTANENRPINIGMTPAIFLGV